VGQNDLQMGKRKQILQKELANSLKTLRPFNSKYFGCGEIPPSPLNHLSNNSALKIAFRPESYFVFMPQTSYSPVTGACCSKLDQR
jgi:hypothetical protein